MTRPVADVQALAPEILAGKVRGRITVPAGAREDQRREAALACPEAQAHLAGKEVVKVDRKPFMAAVQKFYMEGKQPDGNALPWPKDTYEKLQAIK